MILRLQNVKPHLWKDIFNLRAAVRQRLGCAQVLNYVFFFLGQVHCQSNYAHNYLHNRWENYKYSSRTLRTGYLVCVVTQLCSTIRACILECLILTGLSLASQNIKEMHPFP